MAIASWHIGPLIDTWAKAAHQPPPRRWGKTPLACR